MADISSNLAFTTTNQDFQLERSLLEQGDGQFLSCYVLFLLSFVPITSCLCICSLKKKKKTTYSFISGCAGSSLLRAGFLSPGQRGLLFAGVHRLLIAAASLVAEHGR